MKRFCKENPVERIGYQKDGVHDIKKHRWFQVSINIILGVTSLINFVIYSDFLLKLGGMGGLSLEPSVF